VSIVQNSSSFISY